ncbi:hypothetical protein PVAND_015512 [Polypedilum vanderplanki]|uniref:Uncharacterized protein n=1 Tax=Polypedilum vanderplanki TaxID=319348 RepID=A0A9J6BCS7_POLVA|nr:hypothetical protein PVAND_015512 [Polypedilum vanderplanki]
MLKFAIKKFFNESSVHGFQYLTKAKVHLVERVFWLLSIVISYVCSGILIYQIGVKVKEDLTVTYTSDIAVSVTEIPFPSVSFCFEILQLVDERDSYTVVKKQLLSNEIKFDNLTENEQEIMQALSLILSDKFLTKLNITEISTNNLVSIIEKRSVRFEAFMTRSEFGYLWGVNFARILGPYGFCYNFNIAEPKDLYQNLEHASRFFNFSRDFYKHQAVSRFYSQPLNPNRFNVTYPMKVPISNGIFSLQIAHLSRIGNKVERFLHLIKEFPFFSPYIFIHDGYESYTKESLLFNSNKDKKMNLFIKPKQILIDESLMSYSADVRQCYFQPKSENDTTISEKSLKFFKKYTKANCRHECEINKTLEICGCVQFFMIHLNTTRICGIFDFNCYHKIEIEMKNNDECKCYPYCGEIIYNAQNVELDIIKTRNATKFKVLEATRKDKHYSQTVIMFHEKSFFPYILKRQFTELDFLSYTGGALGLFLGFSVLSSAEVFYYFTIRIIFEIIRKNRKNRRIADISENNVKNSQNDFRFYLDNSTIHGMNQIGMRDRNFIERIIWLICLISAVIYSSKLSYEIYERYRDAPIAITYDSSERSVKEIPFPAVTLNHEITIDGKLVQALWDIFVPKSLLIKTQEFKNSIIPGILCYYKPILQDFLPKTSFELKNFIEKVEANYTQIEWFQNQSSTWRKNFKPEFLKVFGRSGFGFTFNMLRPEEMFHENVSSDFLKSKVFTLKNPSEITNKIISHKKYPVSGLSFHDKFVISLENNKNIKYEDICSPLQFSLHSPYEMPGDSDEHSTMVQAISRFHYGQDIEIVITPEVIRTDPELKEFDYKRRDCYFENEKNLTMFKVYTRRNCEQECYSNYVLQHNDTQCIGFYQIRNQTNPMCGYKKLQKLRFLYRDFSIALRSLHLPLKHNINENFFNSCECLDRCDDVKYNYEVFETRFKNKSEIDTTRLSFYFKYETFLPLIRHRSITFDEFLGQAGGLLGLFAGISFLSIIELLYFVSLRQIVNFVRYLGKSV